MSELNTGGYQLHISIPSYYPMFRIRIQHLRLNTNPDPIRIQGFYDPKLKKIYTVAKKFDIYLIKKCNFLIPGHP